MKILKSFTLFFLALNFCFASFINSIEKEKLISFFQEYDSSMEKKDQKWNRLTFAMEKGHFDIAEFLISKGEPINSYVEFPNAFSKEYYFSKHPLLTAIRNDEVNLALLMIQTINDVSKIEEFKRKDHNNQFYEKKDVFQVAIEESSYSYDIVLALVVIGKANVNNQHHHHVYISAYNHFSKYITPLHTAIAARKLDVVQLLLDHGADIEIIGEKGMKPLERAVNDNYIEGVKLLLDNGANPLAIGATGQDSLSPIELAMQKGYWDIVDLLLGAAVKEDVQHK